MDKKKLGLTLKKIRLSQNLGVKEVAEKAKIGSSTLYKMEDGIYNSTLSNIKKVCDALNFRMVDFFVLYEHIDKFGLINEEN